MPLKKSQLYSSLWQSCDELRGGMDASQYKDYVLTLLFMKYVSDKYAGKADAVVEIPKGGSFADMVKLEGDKEIGDKINKIIAKLAEANDLKGVIDQADFNDEDRLGRGKDMQDRLSKLVAIFDGLDFSANRTAGDDLLGDAYEYLMRHFATESGKSKGQFYTPAEVSRIMAKVVGIGETTRQDQTIYDPTCGSGSLLLKAADESPRGMSIYGQEMDNATWALARMNMILHGHPTAELWRDNTLAAPHFKNMNGDLKTFDFAVANPPFSTKAWSNGFNPRHDEFHRFDYGVPPEKNGDYAFLLHLLKSLKPKGKGAIILPHGVLFRGNAEADIRRNLVRAGVIRGIIGLPANLFYGTGIPACIVIIDKENAESRKGIFMIDASRGFMKDGPKNRLRDMDIHRIVDVFNRRVDVPGYSRMVSHGEIEKNDFNLNLPRYIDSQTPEDVQDIAAHLQGGIPAADVDALERYWAVCPGLRSALFRDNRPGYLDLAVDTSAIKSTIYEHPEFAAFIERMNTMFDAWREKTATSLKELRPGCDPKAIIAQLSEDLLAHYAGTPLIDPYDLYQRLMDYSTETMQDDAYLIATHGWVKGAQPREIFQVKNKDKLVWPEPHDYARGKRRFKSDLLPAHLLVGSYFAAERNAVVMLDDELATLDQQLDDTREENDGEEGLLSEVIEGDGDKQKISAKAVKARLREIGKNNVFSEERAALRAYADLLEKQSDAKAKRKVAQEDLDKKIDARYRTLTESEVKALVVDNKWLGALDAAIHEEINRVGRQITRRVEDLGERYAAPLPRLEQTADEFEAKVNAHLKQMGFTWA